MATFALAFACLAFGLHGGKIQTAQKRTPRKSQDVTESLQWLPNGNTWSGDPFRALALLLVQLNKPGVGWQLAGHSRKFAMNIPSGIACEQTALPLAVFSNSSPRLRTRHADLSMSFPETKALPQLTPQDLRMLNADRPLQKKMRTGWSGNGMVVMDIKADADDIWSLLLDFKHYDTYISTVREAKVTKTAPGGDHSITLATFVVSKFRFEVSVVHKFNAERQQLTFYLNEASRNIIMKEVEGTWHIQSEAEGLRPGHVRVWLLSSLRVSRLVPNWIMDYAAERALQRATSWLRPLAESRTAKKQIEKKRAKAIGGIGV